MSLTKYLPRRVRHSARALLLQRFGLAVVRQSSAVLLQNPRAQLTPTLEMIVAHYLQRKPNVYFLQIGAFDGVSWDAVYPLIRKYGLTGTLVEPQHDVFCRLKQNYATFDQKSFTFINAAVSESDGSRQLFRIRPQEGRHEWLPGTASFDRALLLQEAGPQLEGAIEVEDVRCLGFDTLFSEYQLPHVDLLQIDAEGYDAEIIRLFDVPTRRPAIVRYEHKHLPQDIQEQTVAALIEQGYLLYLSAEDTLAYCPDY